jgi:hypothetical protein
MLKINLFIFITIISLVLHAQEDIDITHRVIEINQVDVVAQNFVAEIDLGSEFKVIAGISNKRHKDINLAKNEAYFNAVVDNQIDILVDPIYTIRRRGKFLFFFGGVVEAKVVGFAGYYKNVLPESHANVIKFDEYLNDFVDFLALNSKPNVEKEEDINTILNDLSSKNFKENSKIISVNSTLESFINRYEKSKSVK